MNRLELALRTIVRKSGLAGPIMKIVGRKVERHREQLRAEYNRSRPTSVTLDVDGKSAKLKVTNIEEYAHYLSAPEGHIMKVLFDNLKPGDTAWDVGANVGMYTLLIGSAVGPTGTVLGFEPMTPFLERLRENIALNGFRQVKAMAPALGKERATLSIMTSSEGLEGDNRVVRDAAPGAQPVEVIPGDDLRREQGLGVPNLIKIDVQGAEEDVLLGLDKTLRDPACRCIICEIHFGIFAQNNNTEAPIRINRHLAECGFVNIRRLDRNHIGAWKA